MELVPYPAWMSLDQSMEVVLDVPVELFVVEEEEVAYLPEEGGHSVEEDHSRVLLWIASSPHPMQTN